MKLAIAALATVSVLALGPGMALANDITGRLTQSQVDRHCAAGAEAKAGTATFKIGHGETVTGTVNCRASVSSSQSLASAPDDNGTESATDVDSSHED
jgi:hypothetical protein